MRTLVIVTGGSAGLGRALLRAAPPGAHRVDVSRSGPGDPEVSHLAADLADPASWRQVGDDLAGLVDAEPWERITLLHNAATLVPMGFAGEVDADAYTSNVVLNSAAPQVLGHRFLAAVRDRQARRELVMITSGAARKDHPGWSSYGAGKAAVDRWVSTVGVEQDLRGGVRVLAVTPGLVATGMQELIRSTDEHDFPEVARFHALHDAGELTEPDDVARRIWALLDDASVRSGDVLDLRGR